jgi:hypothetical protein
LIRLPVVWRKARHNIGRWSRRLVDTAAIVGALVVLGSAALYVVENAEDQWLWRGDEYNKLTGLRAGFDLSYFESQLGTPTVTRSFRGHQESIFKGRAYWVQTISRGEAVLLYAVTSCDKSFHPTFAPIGSDLQVELNRSQLADVATSEHSLTYDYFVGATAPSLFYEGIYSGFSGYYKTFLWGWNSVCHTQDEELIAPPFGSTPRGLTSSQGSYLEQFRQESLVNTYAETAPATFPRPGVGGTLSAQSPINLHQMHGFSVGPSRVSLQLTS